ncbi:MAG TPA: hypothetical protein VGK73_18200 [Polyangiaceae bacterium]
MKPAVSSMRERSGRLDRAWLGLLAALGLFFVLGYRTAGGTPSWSEEVSVLPARAYPVFEASPGNPELPVELPSCASDPPPRSVVSGVRPVWSTCARGWKLPVMVTPYFSGVPYWPFLLLEPLHGGDAFLQRKFGLALGALGLVLVFLLARRAAGTGAAVSSVLVLACAPSFVLAHSLTMFYETLPWHALVVAALALDRWRAPGASRRAAWLALAGAAFACALLANVKTLFLLAPLVALVPRVRHALPELGWRRWAAVGALGLAGFLPMLAFARLDAAAGLQGQASMRQQAFFANLSFEKIGLELLNLVLFGADTGAYGDQILKYAVPLFWPALVIMALGIGFCLVQSFAFVLRARGNVLAAALGLMFFGYVLVAALLYTQYPSANYGPLSACFGLAVGLALAELGRRSGALVQAGATLIAMLVLGWNCVRRGDPELTFVGSTNANAERDLASYLRDNAGAPGTVVSATYNLTGVFASLGRGRVLPSELLPFFYRLCPPKPGSVTRECVARAWGQVLDAGSAIPPPLRAIVPAVVLPIDDPLAQFLEPALSDAARARALGVSIEHTAKTKGGVPVLRLVRVEAPPKS